MERLMRNSRLWPLRGEVIIFTNFVFKVDF